MITLMSYHVQSVLSDILNKMLYIQSAEQQVLKHFTFIKTLFMRTFTMQFCITAIGSEFVTILLVLCDI